MHSLSRDDIIQKIIFFLENENKPLKARIIAKNLMIYKKEINSILHSNKNKIFEINNNFEWTLKDSQPRNNNHEDNSNINNSSNNPIKITVKKRK